MTGGAAKATEPLPARRFYSPDLWRAGYPPDSSQDLPFLQRPLRAGLLDRLREDECVLAFALAFSGQYTALDTLTDPAALWGFIKYEAQLGSRAMAAREQGLSLIVFSTDPALFLLLIVHVYI